MRRFTLAALAALLLAGPSWSAENPDGPIGTTWMEPSMLVALGHHGEVDGTDVSDLYDEGAYQFGLAFGTVVSPRATIHFRGLVAGSSYSDQGGLSTGRLYYAGVSVRLYLSHGVRR